MKLYQRYRNRFHSPGIHLGYALVRCDAPWYVRLVKIRGFFISTKEYNHWLGFYG